MEEEFLSLERNWEYIREKVLMSARSLQLFYALENVFDEDLWISPRRDPTKYHL
jgi:hypothetical protein